MRHRAKVISHSLQCQLRDRRAQLGVIAKKKHIDNELIKQNSIHNRYNDALLKLFPVKDNKLPNEESDYTNLPIEAFHKCNIDMLRPLLIDAQ